MTERERTRDEDVKKSLRGSQALTNYKDFDKRFFLERLGRDLEQDFIKTASKAASPNYADIDEEFGRSIVESDKEGFDRYGFFTTNIKFPRK